MYFDWITWSIWLVGFIIMIIWILVPIREFKKLVQQKRAERKAEAIKTEQHIDNN
jgi:uncharacterized membrane protein YcjF (UPF0283 family)